MAKAYSNDLRLKIIEAHQQGEGSLEELADQFHVSAHGPAAHRSG
jgi:transposase-like protein